MGVPVDQIDDIAATGATTRPCMMLVHHGAVHARRTVPEVSDGIFYVRMLLQAAAELRDGKKVPASGLIRYLTQGTEIDDLLERYRLV